MMVIILSWVGMLVVFFAFGIFTVRLINQTVRKQIELHTVFAEIPHASLLLVAGMATTTAIASALSLFIPLAGMTGVIVFALAIVLLGLHRKMVRYYLKDYWHSLRSTNIFLILLFIAFIFIAAYLSALLPSHHDYGLYYGTTIKWIEQYGVVKGLANLNPRIGFNSNWHLLQAMFSFHYLPWGPVNNINGMLLFMAFPYSLGGINRMLKRDYRLSVILRALLFLPLTAYHFGASSDYIFFNVNFISSPSADIAVCLMLWLLFTWLVELDGAGEGVVYRRMLLIIVVAAFLFTVKPSSAPVLLACCVLFAGIVYKKQWKLAGFAVGAVACIAVPWLIRNVLISGYLLFPFELDVVNADWKLPFSHVQWHINAVRVYAIDPGYDLNKPFMQGLHEWFPNWFGRMNFIQSLMFLLSIASMLTLMVILTVMVFRRRRDMLKANRHTILAGCIMLAGVLFWLFKGPDPRLGYGFIAMPVMLVLALMLRYFLERDVRYAGFVLIAVQVSIFYFYYRSTWKEIPMALTKPLPERRLPENSTSVNKKGITVNLVFKDDSWFAPLPVANNDEFYTILPEPRGSLIEQGFRSTEKPK